MNIGEAMGTEMVALIHEPTSLSFLALGGLVLARRRRAVTRCEAVRQASIDF